MRKIKKILLFLSIIASFTLLTPVNASMMIEISDLEYISLKEEVGTYSTDEIVYYYRTYEGKVQYRRWNATRGYWIDATWLDVINN